ncbi:hypothetical protein [Marinoscillum sp.]|uniref:hypothetical protein n=1 Tax=Marinoscillum sp. TaxID=2024838 RepID=UPI003BA8F156
MSEDFLSASEVDLFLDWLDKVRIGLWLGFMYLEKGFYPIVPKFHIKKRIGQKDRSLVVYEFTTPDKGVQFSGVNIPCFAYNPSCFALSINNYLFLNTSHDFLYSRSLGFPYPNKVSIDESSGAYMIELEEGLHKVRNNLSRIPFISGGTEIYQPLIQEEVKNVDEYKHEYIQNNTLNSNSNRGSIFFRDYKSIQKLNEDEEICLSPSSSMDRDQFMKTFTRDLLMRQVNLCIVLK